LTSGSEGPGRRTLTPAVLAAALFAVACGIGSIGFVAARGGLLFPVASNPAGVALASPRPSQEPGPTLAPTPEPTAAPAPTSTTAAPTAGASPTPARSPDPLFALPPCPDRPGCVMYTVRRGDTFSGVSDRYLIGLFVMRVLNPEVTDESTIVVGQTLYLARDPAARLEPCPDGNSCRLYVVRSGDTLSIIAGRYLRTVDAILDWNTGMSRTSVIYTGQVIRIPDLNPPTT
jgi:LysM repeat protein